MTDEELHRTDDEPRIDTFTERLGTLYATFAHTADVITRDLPKWLRPIARTLLFIATMLFLAVLVPFVPLFKKQHHKFMRDWDAETRPVHELRLRARRIWAEDSPQAAAAHVRSVFDKLRTTLEGVEVAPYGRFAGVMCMHDLASAAYEYELSVGRVAEALEIADFMCQQTSDLGTRPTWVVSKAKCLVNLGRTPEAKALLLSHRNLYDPSAEVNRYLPRLDRLVHGRRAHPQHRRELAHGDPPDGLSVDRALLYQGCTKRTENRGEPLRRRATPFERGASVSSNLRTQATARYPPTVNCHAGGQGFESPTPRQ